MFNLLTTDDYSYRAEVDEHLQVVLHMDVYRWTPRVAKELKKVFEDSKEAFRLEGFSTMYTITPNPKFVRMIGGGELECKLTHNGEEHEVIYWKLGE